MNINRFKDCDSRTRGLVLAFERCIARGDTEYFDLDQINTVIDFYLNTHDLDMLTEAVEYGSRLFPGDDEIELRRAHMLCAKERFQEAEALLKQLQSRDSGNTDVLYALGALYSSADQSRKAIEYYLLASKDGYELDMVYGNIADEYNKLGQQLNAMLYYKKALEINPKETRSILNLAHTFGSLGDPEGAADYFKKFVEQQPYSAEGWLALGEALADCGLYEHAEDALQYSIAIDKSFYDAYDELAHCYRIDGRYGDAVNTLHEAMPLADNKSDVLCNIAACFLDQKNYVTASIYYKKALDEDPYDTEGRRLLAECYVRLGDYSTAQANLQRAIDLKPCEPEYRFSLGLLLIRMECEDEGYEEILNGIHLGGDRIEYWLQAADSLMDNEWWDTAGTLLTDALSTFTVKTEPTPTRAAKTGNTIRDTSEEKNDNIVELQKRIAECMYQTKHRDLLLSALKYLGVHDTDALEELVHKHPDLLTDGLILDMLRDLLKP